MTASATTNAIVRPADIAAATEKDSHDDAHRGAGSGWPGLPRHVVRDDGAGYGNVQRRGKTQAILTLRQFQHR